MFIQTIDCNDCENFDNCSKQEKNNKYCDDYVYKYKGVLSISCEDNTIWKEISYNRYTEGSTDYGELSEWDIYLLEEDSKNNQ